VLAVEPDNTTARFFHALAVLAASGLESGGNANALATFQDLLLALGYQRSAARRVGAGDPFLPPASDSLPRNMPNGEQSRAFLAGPALILISTALDDLAALPADFNLILNGKETGVWQAVQIDHGDVLLLRAALSLTRSLIQTVTAYNWNCDLHDLLSKGFMGMLDLQKDILDAYPDFGRLRNDAVDRLRQARADSLSPRIRMPCICF